MTAKPSRWLRRDTSLSRPKLARTRRILGVAILAAGLMLVVSVFLDWGHIAIGAGVNSIAQVSVSGAGTVSVSLPQDDPGFEREVAHSLEHLVSHSGLWVAAIGILIAAAGAAYLWLPRREETGIAVAALAGVGSVLCLSCAFNAQRIFGDAFGLGSAHYRLGFGLMLACTTTLVLVALGLAGLALERTTPCR